MLLMFKIQLYHDLFSFGGVDLSTLSFSCTSVRWHIISLLKPRKTIRRDAALRKKDEGLVPEAC